MRLVVCVLACVGAGGMALALADPPANPAPTATAPSSGAQPAASAPAASPSASAPAAKPQGPTVDVDAQKEDQLEKHFLAEGYKLEMHNGEKYFCRREEVLGSHLSSSQKQCGTAQQLKLNEDESQAAFRRGQMQQGNAPQH